MSEELAKAVREALRDVPCSDRALALKADIPASTISRIRSAERGATPEVARALADALARWTESTEAAEAILRRALEREESP